MPGYVDFSEIHAGTGRLTKRWHVLGRNTRTILGEVSWYAHWRRYVFYPALTHQCLFDSRCLIEIADFCENETLLQRADADRRRAERRAAELPAGLHHLQNGTMEVLALADGKVVHEGTFDNAFLEISIDEDAA